ncbi:mRNA interferase EndoA [Gemmata sp. SH-PL17]|uniref:type II toxin-antitoxin system PemK/MazF family toxin n=1 Tax=Gemmata sp. SH-PL17 TaxID=1630693 RepID=UPI00078CEAFE|nr:type II toxin-antitoxin system PemK/MazF family toxin [Gemmata sp. SH-PL17]AMV23137.1 mRNA interferase EndoA [Gemmata sp. SH-PL17]
MKQGEIYLVNLDPIIGLELGGAQFVIIVSNDIINASFLPVTVVPARDAADGPVPRVTGVYVPSVESGLAIDVVADCLQLRALDRSRFVDPPVGTLSPTKLKDVERAIHFAVRV